MIGEDGVNGGDVLATTRENARGHARAHASHIHMNCNLTRRGVVDPHHRHHPHQPPPGGLRPWGCGWRARTTPYGDRVAGVRSDPVLHQASWKGYAGYAGPSGAHPIRKRSGLKAVIPVRGGEL